MAKQDDGGNSDSLKDTVTNKVGYDPKELLTAPLKPPKASKAPPPTSRQRAIIGSGILLAVFGLLIWGMHRAYPLGLIMLLLGVGALLWGMLVRR